MAAIAAAANVVLMQVRTWMREVFRKYSVTLR
jgi:hypothetical protein